MATTQTLNAQFTADDILTGSLGTRADIYNLATSGPTTVTLSNVPSGGFIAFDPNGSRVATGMSGTSFVANPGVNYKIAVGSSTSLPQNYTLQANVTGGNLTLTPDTTAFAAPQTGATATFNGQLDGSGLIVFSPTVMLPVTDSDLTPLDEYELDVSSSGQPIDVAVTSIDPGFDPYVEVFDANSGSLVTFDDNSGRGNNSLANFISSAGADYRIHVLDADG